MPSARLLRAASAFCILLCGVPAGRGQGTLYLSNLGERVFGNNAGYGSQSFQTGTAGGGYALNAITLQMGAWLGYATNFTVGVYSDAGGQPGSILDHLTGDADPERAGQYSYEGSGFVLNAGTVYWLVASCDQDGDPPPHQPPGGYCWQFTSSPSYASSDGWILNPAGNSAGSGFAFQVGVQATAVPEPGSLTLASLGFIALLARKAVG